MEIKQDEDVYELQHEGILRGLFSSVHSSIKEAAQTDSIKIDDSFIEGVVENIVFGVAAVIDGSAVMEFEGKEIHPHLTFKNERTSKELIVNSVGSYLHEMVMGYLDEYDLEDL